MKLPILKLQNTSQLPSDVAEMFQQSDNLIDKFGDILRFQFGNLNELLQDLFIKNSKYKELLGKAKEMFDAKNM